jgi:NAD+ synthase (glutamine-hydrolysing)
MSTLNIALAQINSLVGDLVGNTEIVINTARRAIEQCQADVIIFPELTLTGYPPEDLLLRPSLDRRVERALAALRAENFPAHLVIGYPRRIDGKLYNLAGVIHEGRLILEYAKQCLPNYQVFDEKRYFVPGSEAGVFEVKGAKIGLTVCEDMWDGAPVAQAAKAGVDLLVNISASPFHMGKQHAREALIQGHSQALGKPLIFVNWAGGQDELVFDGGSVAYDGQGRMVARGARFDQSMTLVHFDAAQGELTAGQAPAGESVNCAIGDDLKEAYDALVLGVRDYVNKNRFKGVVLGLSGGIDSALTLAIAADALGPKRVEAVMMPFRYTSQMSLTDAEHEARLLNVNYRSISIETIYDAFMESLAGAFAGTARDTTEENLQARSRGVLLMALSNKLGYLVLTTGNKSEMAVGYATLYGDMAGGLDVLKDVPKTLVFKLARYRNTLGGVIPETVITRPPSAELAPDQKDEDSLPPYEVLDEILELYIERDCSHQEIVARGFDAADVQRVIRLVDLNEYKRRQAAVGIRISERAFGRDRRYPITNGWHIGD